MNRRQFLLLATAGSFGAALGVSELMKFAAQPAPVSATTAPTWLYSASDNPAGGHSERVPGPFSSGFPASHA